MPSARSTDELVIAPLSRTDLDAVVAIHARAFPDAAMTAFGREALRRYYTWLFEGPHDAALMGASLGTRLVGFCAAGWYRGAVSGFLRANRWYLASRIVRHPSLLGNELIRDRIAQAAKITVRFSRLKSSSAAPARPRFGVLSIATDPDVRGSGAGRALMLEAEARARAGGHDVMVLTVHPSNVRAVRFYEDLGWTRRPAPDGAWRGNMERRLSA
jgi:ribosomal protein S18 acetylase RimI-like enzyme